ncbi:MAG: hypothetical protein E7201_04220 [Selenomonas ruminantium]|uniref:Uncharacterized protein n=1 Tax=Selenomonas ruminantium TaxID=971 RepID=A0A927WMU3_SELRU|nr:hypothetical protein [Selenomonas ruminantium]
MAKELNETKTVEEVASSLVPPMMKEKYYTSVWDNADAFDLNSLKSSLEEFESDGINNKYTESLRFYIANFSSISNMDSIEESDNTSRQLAFRYSTLGLVGGAFIRAFILNKKFGLAILLLLLVLFAMGVKADTAIYGCSLIILFVDYRRYSKWKDVCSFYEKLQTSDSIEMHKSIEKYGWKFSNTGATSSAWLLIPALIFIKLM